MKKNNRNGAPSKRERLTAILANDCDIPPELLCGGCFIEIRGRNGVVVRGCRRILKYSTERILLKMRREVVEVTGKRLTCLTYFSGAVSIEGIIDSLCFVKGQERTENEA